MSEEVTVVVATRNRGASIARTLASLIGCARPAFAVDVIDQSDDDATAGAVRPFLTDSRVRYVRSRTRGLASAHNVAIAGARTELVAITDDDCEVARDWLGAIVRAFTIDRRIGVVFGSVLPGHDAPASAFVPCYERAEPFLARSLRDKARIDGMGACMAIRRTVWSHLGGFDERFGAGGPFHAANEGDFVLRALEAGWFVYETPEAAVTHHGARTYTDARELVHRYAYGTGAMMAKHVRAGTPHTARLLGTMGWRWLHGHAHSATCINGRRHRLLRLRGFAAGFAAGALSAPS